MKIFMRVTCFFLGHGPFVEGLLAGRWGRFCLCCDTFFAKQPEEKEAPLTN
jgi:hypothetical protein